MDAPEGSDAVAKALKYTLAIMFCICLIGAAVLGLVVLFVNVLQYPCKRDLYGPYLERSKATLLIEN